MLLLSQQDIQSILTMGDCIPLMREALAGLARGEAQLPLRTVMILPGEKTNAFALMPAYVAKPESFGAKIITVFPGNHGTPFDSHQGAVLLFESEYGGIRAILDATVITAVRTAAVTAVATDVLARQDAKTLCIMGSAVQAKMHIESIPLVRPIERIVVWSRDHDHARAVVDEMRPGVRGEIVAVADARAAVEQADVVCTTTAAREPVLRGEWLRPGTHVNAIGASQRSARELDTEAVKRARVFADRRESALKEPGDILVPLEEGAITPDHIVGEIGEVLIGRIEGRRNDQEITVFKSLGLAIEDLHTAYWVTGQAEARGLGTKFELGGARA